MGLGERLAMNHPRALFLAVVAVILGLVCMIVYQVDATVFWLSLVALGVAWLILEFYKVRTYGRVADRQWQARNPKPQKVTRAVREELRVVRGSDGSGRRVMV
jgi:hypothetical protein